MREGLVAAAAALLKPGGLFYCSYNTHPGWLARSTLQMLSVEEGLRAGGQTSLAGILKAAATLERLTGEEADPWPLGAALPGLRAEMKGLDSVPKDYLRCEYHSAHQPLYVGPMHRMCAAHGLSHIGSASLPEMFPQWLDPDRRCLVMEAADAPMREVLLDLAINQSFRRDLFARGVRTPSPAWRREALAELGVVSCVGPGDDRHVFENSLGRLGIDPLFIAGLKDSLAAGRRTLGELLELFALELEDLVQRLVILDHAGVIAFALPAGAADEAPLGACAAFQRRWLERTTTGDPIPFCLSPVLRQPVALPLLEGFFLQAAGAELSADDAVQLVWMGLTMAGGVVNDADGQTIDDPQQALAALREFHDTFVEERLPVLQRLGIAPAAPAGP
ncbi:MAG: hypothetical protein ER33_11870 [Cyanobium sp. CACIAM 14]|nr:MAG: hypothetical protein ER33_11870 [Cyanobium sp. CACIAM 14]